MSRLRFPIYLICLLIGLAIVFIFSDISNAMVISKTPTLTTSLNTGLVGWWTFDAKETTITTTTDKSGNGYDATRSGGVKFGIGRIGQGLILDGSNDYVYAPKYVTTSGDFAVSFWMKTNSSTTKVLIGNRGGGSISSGFAIYTSGVNIIMAYANGTTAATQTAGAPSPSYSNNKWHHVVFSVNRSNGINLNALYLDGIAKTPNSGTVTGTVGTALPLAIGAYYGGSFPFLGSLDDARVYNRALSANEVQQLYKQGGGKISKSPTAIITNLNTNLISWWTFDGKDTTITTTTDRSGNGSNGKRFGGTKTQPGIIGQGIYYNGTTDYVTSSGNTITGSNKFTLAAWVKVKAFRNDYSGVLSIGNGTTGNSSYIGLLSTNVFGGGFWSTNLSTGVTPVLNRWYHLVGVYDNDGKWRMYVDGVQKGTPTAATPNITGANIVSGRIITTYYFNGAVDDARVYSRALPALEIMELYKQGGGKISKTPSLTTNLNTGLTGWWTFDGKTVTSVTTTDSSGNGNHGTRTLGPYPKTGKIGQGMYFDGSNDSISVPYNTSSFDFAVSGGMTMSAWVKPVTLSASYNFFGGVGSATDGGGCMIYIGVSYQAGIQCQKITGATIPWSQTYKTGAIPNNKWSFILVTYNYSTEVSCVSVNGSIPTCSTGGQEVTPNYGSSFTIGKRQTSTFLFNGIVDDFRYYNRIISQAEIQQLYRMGK